jgi:hypothetical protein
MRKLMTLSEGELDKQFSENIQEAIDLNKNDIRRVRGKYRSVPRIYADYQEEADGTLTFLGYVPYHQKTDFTCEVNKCADHSIDFGHFYHIKRQVAEFEGKFTHGTTERDNLGELHNNVAPSYLNADGTISVSKAGLMGHFESDSISYSDYKFYVAQLYKKEQEILKSITDIAADMYKGEGYNKVTDTAEKSDQIRGRAVSFTGAAADRCEVDIITEIELILIDIFDKIDNTSCTDEVKLDIVRYAAERVAKKHLGKTSALAKRTSPRGTGKLKIKANPTHMADKLINDMKNYTIDALGGSDDSDERAEYYDNLDMLRKSIASKKSDDDYIPTGEGDVTPRLRTAKKRGDGYTTYKKMSSKYKSEHADDIDDDNW